jgi:ATP/maltotriose-dependent transcriptional regulator MalT
MKKMNYLYTILIFSAMFVSCNKKTDRLLEKIENIVEQQPDSALILLDSVGNHYSLTDKQEAKYALFLVRAKDCAYRDIAKDSLIFGAKDYFKKKNEVRYQVLAEFYSGRVFQAQGRYDTAMAAYLEAEKSSANSNDSELKDRINYFIGEIYYHRSEFDKAIERFKLSLKYFGQSPDKQDSYRTETAVFNILGNSFLLKNPSYMDSAMVYYDKALQLAEVNKDTALQAAVRQNSSVSYLLINRKYQAKQQLFQAIELNSDLQDKIYLNLGRVYEQEGITDSALYFVKLSLELLEKKNDIPALSSIYRLLSKLEEQVGNYKKALEYRKKYEKYMTQVWNERKQHNIQEIEKKYNFELLRNEKDKLYIEKQFYIIVLLCLTLIAGIILYYMEWRNRRNQTLLRTKDEDLEKIKANLLSEIAKISGLEEKLQESLNLNDDTKGKEKTFRSLTLKTMKKDVSLGYCKDFADNKITKDEFIKRIKKVLDNYKTNMWNTVYEDLNKFYNNVFDNIRNQYPSLTNEEFKVACLIYAGFGNEEIIQILQLNDKHAIHQKRTDIRRKLKISFRGDIKQFLHEKVNKKTNAQQK